MKKVLLSIIPVLILSLLCGCARYFPEKVEMENIVFIRTVGVDKINEGENKVRLTIISRVPGGGGVQQGQGGGQKGAEVITSDGRTLFEANRRFHSFTDKDIFWGHTEFIFIGEEAARDNILQYLDFFFRDHEIRLNAKVIIVKGTTAENLIKTTNTEAHYVSERIHALLKQSQFLGIADEIKIIDFVNLMESKWSSAYTPYVRLVDRTKREKEETKDIKLEGMAYFQKADLGGYLREDLGRGFNFLRGRVRSGALVVKDTAGDALTMEIIDTGSKIKPKLENGNFSVRIELHLETVIGEQMGRDYIYTYEKLMRLRKQQEELVKKEAEKVIKYSQQNGVDILGIGEAINRKYPVEFKKIAGKNWEKVYPSLKIDVTVHSLIRRTYNIEAPLGSQRGPQKP